MVIGLPAWQDNYLWLLIRAGKAVAVDPGDADRVSAELDRRGLSLEAILLTHHHPDHIGGVAALVDRYRCPVFGADDERIPATHRVREGDQLRIRGMLSPFEVWEVPGHTRTHLAYRLGDWVFAGDTIFAGGCGRVFEGEPAALYRSLMRIAALPPETVLFPAHEYTLDNLRFALALEPDSELVNTRYRATRGMRAERLATVPVTVAQERASNPFLRVADPGLQAAASACLQQTLNDPESVFVAIRGWKNRYVVRHDA
ncbi:hydroxyacylglutathione hydrolase [Ahniella affigens]|uniref:Hydroxyacylglutathione hydrolase n=2 Tax=Ahniella affigens TaxID=2021234 RepID=A0A2P1PYU3_9GAMM|nr:hydroxyacylglutathione hydrolase [Ahniella affigens]